MPAPKKYPDEVRERAVRMVFEIREELAVKETRTTADLLRTLVACAIAAIQAAIAAAGPLHSGLTERLAHMLAAGDVAAAADTYCARPPRWARIATCLRVRDGNWVNAATYRVFRSP